MRLRRLSVAAGWTAVVLLAIAGFAAFGNPSPSAQQVRVEAATASMGHTSGAYAGLAFALFGTSEQSPSIDLDVPEGFADPDPDTLRATIEGTNDDQARRTQPSGEGTIASSTSGWLSQVEVRALASQYFEPEDVNRAVRVAWCESRFDPNSVNLRTGGIGLFQHLPRYWAERSSNAGFRGVDATDPAASTAAAAWEVYEGGGWDVFTCRG
jgi:hypothetical protein